MEYWDISINKLRVKSKFLFMDEWKEYKLEDVCTDLSDGLHKAPKFVNGGDFIFVNAKNISNGFIVDNDPTKKSTYEEFVKYSSPLNETTVLYSIDGTIGNIALYRGEKCILGKGACYLNPNPALLDRMYLYYELQASRFKSYIDKMSTGSTIKHISLKTMRNYEMRVPSINIQQQIVSILKSLDDKIEVNKRINDNLEKQAQALFKSWFVDFEPFKDGEFVESELGMIPKGWKLKRIYEYVDVIYGAPYKSSLFNDNKEGLPLIRIRDLKTNTPQFYTPEILPNTEYIKAGDIVAGMDAEFTPYVWQGERGVLNQRCCKFKGKYEGISNYYILFLVKPELEYVQSYKTGTTVSHLGKSDIDRFVFLTPPLDIVLAFSEIVNPMIKEVVNRAKEARRLATLRDTLLPKLMSGEIKVNDMQLSENQ